MTGIYQPLKPAHRQYHHIRNLRYSLLHWGDPSARPLFLLHGWMDVGMSFQFLADVLSDEWYLIAPDWRGFGDTEWNPGGYWFPDYLADLDALLRIYSPDLPVQLVGHSMGGGIAWLYAGSCPDRVSHVANLDFIGLAATDSGEAPHRYAKWLQQLRKRSQSNRYQELDMIADQIRRLAPRIPSEQARYLAEHRVNKSADGGFQLKADPAHKNLNPVLYRWEETRSCWRNITAKNLLVLAEESHIYKRYREEGVREQILESFAQLNEHTVAAAGHMLHLERPLEVARILEPFLRS